jgi:hypothetical protein
MSRIRRSLLAPVGAVALALAVAACGGAGPLAGSDPASVVTQAMSVIQQKDFNKLTELACAAQKDKIAEQFTGGLSAAGGGFDPAQILAAINIDTSKVSIGTPQVSGDNATVPLSGTMKITIDPQKLKPILAQALASQGLPTDDASVDAAMGMMGTISGQDIPMDNQPVKLVKENGAWKICTV